MAGAIGDLRQRLVDPGSRLCFRAYASFQDPSYLSVGDKIPPALWAAQAAPEGAGGAAPTLDFVDTLFGYVLEAAPAQEGNQRRPALPPASYRSRIRVGFAEAESSTMFELWSKPPAYYETIAMAPRASYATY